MTAEIAVVKSEIGFTNTSGFELIQRASKALAASDLVPKAFRGNMANCMIALNMAERMQADPLMVMQNLYVVQGHPSWSAQFLIACFNQCGRFSSIRFNFIGERGKDNWGCQATATELSTGEIVTGPEITIELAKKEGWYAKPGSKWQTIPELMLRYRSAAWLIRTIAPEIGMGFHTSDEMRDGLGAYDADAEVVETPIASDEKLKSTLDSIVDAAEATPQKSEPKSEPKKSKAKPDPITGEPAGLPAEDIEFMKQALEEDGDLFKG
jgi:hypothetical protein